MTRTLVRGAVVAAVLGCSTFLVNPIAASAQPHNRSPLETRIETLERQVLELQAAVLTTQSASGKDASSAASLRQHIEDLSIQLKILARQLEIEREQQAERAKAVPQIAAGLSGFSLQSADGQHRLRLRGYVQSDSRFFLDDAQVGGIDTFVLRRVRPIFEATMYRLFDVRVMPDFGGGTTVLQDAYLDIRLRPQLMIRAGKFKPPLGLERLMSATEMPFIERALPTSLVPNRDLGLMVHGNISGGVIAYGAGFFNGVVDGGSADADIQDGKDAVARLFVQPWRSRRDSRWQGLGLGVAGSYGNQHGVAATATALPVFRTSGQSSFFAYRADGPVAGPALADGPHTRISAQGYYYAGSFGLLGEHVLSSQKVRRGVDHVTLRHSAWQLAGSWVLTGEAATARSVTPANAFDLAAGTWGALELTGRYSALDVDRDAFPVFASEVVSSRGAGAWAGGLNWFLNTVVKVQVNFERTTFTSAGTARRRPENSLLTRVQFAF